MTRFEIIQRFASDERTHRDHTFTLHVLTEMWLTQGKPDPFMPDFEDVLRLVRTSRRNLFRWVAELETFGFIGYQRGKNQHGKSVISFVGSVQYGTANPAGSVQYGTATGLPVSDIAQRGHFASVQYGTATNLPVSNMAQQPGLVVSNMAQQNAGSVQSGTADSELSTPEIAILSSEGQSTTGNVDNSISGQPFLVYNNNHLIKDSIISKEIINKGDDHVKGVQGKKQKREKPGRDDAQKLPVCKFSDSPLADLTRFREAFGSDNTAKAADLAHYHERVLNWRDKSGNIPERADWLATAKTFLLNDYREGKLVTVTTIKPLNANANANSRNNNRSAVIEPESAAGRRFGGW